MTSVSPVGGGRVERRRQCASGALPHGRQRHEADRVARLAASQRRRSGSVIGLSGWFSQAGFVEQAVADEEVALIDRAAGRRKGRAGDDALDAERSASASPTGPILPSGVESKVEQYLKTNLPAALAPAASRAPASDCATASAAGIERLFSATTPASISAGAGSVGRPRNCAVREPPWPGNPLASVLAMSLAPVKSSAITPSNIVLFLIPVAD